MKDLKKTLIEVLEKEIALWDDAAARCDFLSGYVVEEQKQQFELSAANYKARADELRALLKEAKEST